MRVHRSYVGFAAAVVLMIALTPAVSGQSSKDPDVQKLIDAYVAAWAKGDAKALAALHTADAVRSGSDGVIHSGRTAIEQAFSQGFATVLKDSKLAVTSATEVTVSPDVRIGTGTWEIVGGAMPEGSDTKGTYINTLVRQSGRWLIAGSAAIGAAQ